MTLPGPAQKQTARSGRLISDRTVLIIIVFTTLVLLLGSAVLQRIVFRAEAPTGILGLDPNRLNLTAAQTATFKIKLSGSEETPVVGSQLKLVYNPEQLEVVNYLSSQGWQTVSSRSALGELAWVLVPEEQKGVLLKAGRDLELGTVQVKALKTGGGKIEFDQALTLVTTLALDWPSLPQRLSLTFQGAVGAVGLTSDNPPPPVEPITGLSSEVGSANQRLSPLGKAPKVITGNSSAILVFPLNRPGLVSLEYGATPGLGREVSALQAENQPVLQLVNLEAETIYYYRYRISEANSTVIGPLQTIRTRSLSSDNPAKDQVKAILAASRGNSYDLYLQFFSPDNQLLTKLKPRLDIRKINDLDYSPDQTKVLIGEAEETGGIYKLPISGSGKITAQLMVDDSPIGWYEISLNPLSDSQPKTPVTPTADLGALQQLLAASLLIVLILGFSFVRLARIH